MPKKYRVQKRGLYAAERNPYRPSQKIKRGPWKTVSEFDNWSEARTRAISLRGGLSEVRVCLGTKAVEPNEYTGALPEQDPLIS